MASGDVLAHGSVQERARGYGAGHRYDFRPMFAAIRPLVSAADLAVCHLETPLSPSGRRLSGYPRFNAPSQLAAAIHLPRARPWLVNLLSPGRILADTRAARRAGSQFTIVFLHWGQEYRATPTPTQRTLARRLLADPSVDLIVGHHAHVVQPVQRVNGKWVAFGMGNLLSAQSASCCPAATQDGVLLQVTIVHKAGRMVVGKVSYIPTWLEHPSYRILPVAKALARGSASPATRALLRRSLQRTTTAIGRSAHLAARR
jgi:poly-gamma-glutamate capsule biosynthesis protein CapA/YwtB (metallophosphatase superfamily)